MRFLVRFRPTRAVLLTIARRGALRRSMEEAIKRDLLSRQVVADIGVLPPGIRQAHDDGAEAQVRSSVG